MKQTVFQAKVTSKLVEMANIQYTQDIPDRM